MVVTMIAMAIIIIISSSSSSSTTTIMTTTTMITIMPAAICGGTPMTSLWPIQTGRRPLSSTPSNAAIAADGAFGRWNMARYGRQSTASKQWWDQYNLGLMGIHTGSVASQLGLQHRRPKAWEKPARVVAAKKTLAAAPVHHARAAKAKGDGELLWQVGGFFLCFSVLAGLYHAILAHPACLISFAAIGGVIVLCCRYCR
jgi:hypothetical protein